MAVKKNAQIIEELMVDGVGKVIAGNRLCHPQFGIGVVEEIFEYDDGTNTIRLNFPIHGSKALVPEYAKLSMPEKSGEKNYKKSFIGTFLNAIRGKNT